MSCSSGSMTKKRIITFIAVVGIAFTIYAVSVVAKNFAVLALSPLALGFLACPLMCGAMGVGVWLAGRRSRNKQKANLEKNIGRYSQIGLDNEHESHYCENNGTRRTGNESSTELDSAEAKINSDNNHNLNPRRQTPKNDSKVC